MYKDGKQPKDAQVCTRIKEGKIHGTNCGDSKHVLCQLVRGRMGNLIPFQNITVS